MKKIFNEFKTFIARGNVIDLSVGVVMGTAFSKIVTSLVNDVIMPLVGIAIGGIDFTSLSTGEKLIVSIIIYVVLNNLMGTDIIILDDFNDLDAENAAHAKDIVQAVYRDLGITTIFVAGCAV